MMAPEQEYYRKMALSFRRKLRVSTASSWEHHRSGWAYVIKLIRDELHCDEGTTFVGSVDDEINDRRVIDQPWVGVVHQAPHNNLPWFDDLSRFIHNDVWLASKASCRGLFVLSTRVKRYLVENKIGVPVNRIFYPTPRPARLFSLSRFKESSKPKILFIGEYLRNFQAFYDLIAPEYEKVLLKPQGFNENGFVQKGAVRVIDRVTDFEYDVLLEENVVFLNLFDAPANTTIVECMARGTPVVVNKLEGVVEYLGEDYPLYYETLDQATSLLSNKELISAAHEYLKSPSVTEKIGEKYFLRAFQNTAIYRSLPTPARQGTLGRPSTSEPTENRTQLRSLGPEAFDVSVVICSYKRVQNIPGLLDCFAAQDFSGRFEIFLWNNNFAAKEELDRICEAYKDRLTITIIHSSENFYCGIRLAIAPLIHSKLILICDDDVLPARSYISTFLAKHEEYGNDAILCCRGHVFRPHELNEDEPQRFWDEYEHLQFFDEAVDDRQVHFMHADNCLIPKHLMLKATAFEFVEPEYVLIDDYWLSFVFSHYLGVPIWKIKGDHIMRMTESADDPKTAMFHNPLVREQRVNFYVEHMRRGWPPNLAAVVADAPKVTEQENSSVDRAGAKAETKADIWRKGFHGVNMFSEAHVDDFRAAAECGVSVVRFGATGGATDFRYLVDDTGSAAVINQTTLTRLKRAVTRAGSYGLNVVLTLTHIPGRLFEAEPDLRLWNTESYQTSVAQMWGKLAQELVEFQNVIGYDVINEPLLPDEVNWGLFDQTLSQHSGQLDGLYERIVHEIRKYDSETMIILESSYWASPLSIGDLKPNSDPNVAYSFHMYDPKLFTDREKNRGLICYPGLVPFYPLKKWVECQFWDKEELANFLRCVSDWQDEHGIPAHRIFVGEFGTCREMLGAEDYLADLVSIFGEKGWSWASYAFREDAWDAMDYELSGDKDNMLDRHRNSLFEAVAQHFK